VKQSLFTYSWERGVAQESIQKALPL